MCWTKKTQANRVLGTDLYWLSVSSFEPVPWCLGAWIMRGDKTMTPTIHAFAIFLITSSSFIITLHQAASQNGFHDILVQPGTHP